MDPGSVFHSPSAVSLRAPAEDRSRGLLDDDGSAKLPAGESVLGHERADLLLGHPLILPEYANDAPNLHEDIHAQPESGLPERPWQERQELPLGASWRGSGGGTRGVCCVPGGTAGDAESEHAGAGSCTLLSRPLGRRRGRQGASRSQQDCRGHADNRKHTLDDTGG